MAVNRPNRPRLRLQLFALTALIAGLFMGYGLPALLMSQSGGGDAPQELIDRSFQVLGGCVGIAVVLFAMSFLVPKQK